MGEGRAEIRRQHAEETETAIGEAQDTASKLDARQLWRIQQTGVLLLVIPSTANGTKIGAQEWRNSLFLHYVIEPPDLLSHCNGCRVAFSICHALDCKNCGLITAHHNDLYGIT